MRKTVALTCLVFIVSFAVLNVPRYSFATVTSKGETWANDVNKNKVDDYIENGSGSFDIFVNYDKHPGSSDVASLSSYAKISHVYENFDMISARDVPKGMIIHTIVNLPDITMVEWQGPPDSIFLDVSTRSVKARQSATYSPHTAWDLGYRGQGVTIAVLDSGVDNDHEAFNDKFVTGYNAMTEQVGDPDDDNGHGTHVAGTALGTGGPSQTYIGVAPEAKLVDVKVLDSSGYGSADDVIEGIDWVISQRNSGVGINIINLSLGPSLTNSNGTDKRGQAVKRAVDAGIVVVAAAGNDGPGRFIGGYAAADGAITVAAIDDSGTVVRADDTIWDYSSRGPRDSDGDADLIDELKPDVAAPGVVIMAPRFNTINEYWAMDGTSMAAPHVAGIVALMLERDPNLSPETVKRILRASAENRDCTYDPFLDLKYDVEYGWGIVDAYEALTTTVVGGIALSVDKFGLLASYVGLASTILAATAATTVYVRRVRRGKEKQ